MADVATQKAKSVITGMIRAARPVHWIKNLSLFAAIFLTGALFDKGQFKLVSWGFVSFCLASSATYLVNDILDRNADRLHPTKKFRPVASGNLPVSLAAIEAVILALGAIFVAKLGGLHSLFISILFFYLIMQFFYSILLKNIPIIDILIIATGFVLRVYAGAVIINAHLSVWFLLCVISVALFLASGKRRAEINVAENLEFGTRKSLGKYKKELLNSYVTMFGNASWMAWALFTFFESPKASIPFWLLLAELSRTTAVGKLLMSTIPITIFGMMRYEALIFEGKSETPERLLLTDKALLIAITLWVVFVYFVLYSGVSVGI